MRQLHQQFRQLILRVINLFYPLFKQFMPLQTFRYAACGGFNTLLDIALSIFAFHFIFYQNLFVPLPALLPKLAIEAPIAAFLFSFCFTFPIGFYFSRYIVFQANNSKKSTQLAKYLFIVFICVMLNYGFLKIFVNVFNWPFFVSKIVTTMLVVSFSYISQKHFTFKAVVED
ncbi:MAG: GtrA family protein [Deinococcales bacterium]|nr:GtrA family protein [Chitinophagaceae bacterium]